MYITSLKENGCKVGVVSSAATWMVDQILSQLDLKSLFDVVITQEHVTKHKPDPEAYNLALAQLDVHSKDALVFEDSCAGLKAAHAAGCDAVAVQHDFNTENDLSLAIKVISDFSGASA